MDFLAALALCLMLEGLVLALAGPSVPRQVAALLEGDPAAARWIGLTMIALGAAGYILIRG